MAGYGDFTLFNPGEGNYRNPGQYKIDAEAAALQKATTMTEMDKFYKEIDERGRQFDVASQLQRDSQEIQKSALDEEARQFDIATTTTRDQFGQTLDFTKGQFEKTFGLESARLVEEGRQFDIEAGMKQATIAIQKNLTAGQLELLSAQTGLTGAQEKSSGISDTLGILMGVVGGANFLTSDKGLGWTWKGTSENLSALGSSVWGGVESAGETVSETDWSWADNLFDW